MIFNSRLSQNDLMIFNSRLSQCLDVPDLPDGDWPSSAVHFLRMISWSLTVGFFVVLMFITPRMILWSLTAGFLNVLMFQTYLMRTDHPLLFISWEWSLTAGFLGVSDLPDEDWSSSAVHFLRMIFNSRLSWCLDVPDLPDEDWSPSAVRLVHARGTWKSQFLCCHCCLDLLRAGAGADEEPPSSSTDGWFADALRCRCPYSWAVLLCVFSAFHVSYMYFVLSD